MDKRFEFRPPRRAGLLFQVVTLTILGVVIGVGLRQLSQAEQNPIFLLYLLPILLAVIIFLFFAYFAYSLYRSYYLLEQDGLHLYWGLRAEVIPMDVILGMRILADDFPRPWLRLPGAVLGLRQSPEAGKVEFIAARSRKLVLVRTSRRSYAISPSDPEAFLQAYRQVAEFGSLYPIPAQSIYPSVLLVEVWSDRLARILILAGLVVGVLLLGGVSLYIPVRDEINLGFTVTGARREAVPAIRLLLLPVLNGLIWLVDLVVGLYFYRGKGRRWLAYLLWGGGVLTGLLFLVSVLFSTG